MNSNQSSSFRLSIGLLLSVILVSGCSGSSSPQTVTGTETVAEANANANANAGSEGNAASIDDGDAVNDESIAATEGEPVDDMLVASEVESVNTDLVVPDPMVRNSTQVTFGIMVPVYQSDALQVRLIWGQTDLTANWVGDEFWSASADFPTSTEHELVVTFSDANGGITLGQYKSVFKTGTNDSEDYQVSAEQFNTERWDTDDDGTSNINELIDGFDPLVNESSILEIRDTTDISLEFITNSFESRIPEERPYNEYYEEQLTYHEGGRPPSGASHIIEINIDENGNGTLSDSRLEGVGLSPLRISYTGTRTHSESSIQWDGIRQTIQDLLDLSVTTESVNTVSIIDERTWSYEETYSNTNDTSDEETTVTERQIDLVGEAIDGSSFCQPVSGSVEIETTRPRDNDDSGWSTRRSITKEIDDQYWRVKSIVTGNEPSETKYLVRELNSTFRCDFVEF